MNKVTIKKFSHENKIRYYYNNEQNNLNYETYKYNELSICQWVLLAESTIRNNVK